MRANLHVALPLLVLLVSSCAVGDVLPLPSGIYESTPEGVWMDLRMDEVVFYDSDGAYVDDDGHVQGREQHREWFVPMTDEDRGDACGDGLWYEKAPLDAVVFMQVGGRFFTWPYLNIECDQTHLILSPEYDALSCDGIEKCFRFSKVDR